MLKITCINCKKNCNEANLKELKGIRYCTAYSEARLLKLYVTNKNNVDSIIEILDLEVGRNTYDCNIPMNELNLFMI